MLEEEKVEEVETYSRRRQVEEKAYNTSHTSLYKDLTKGMCVGPERIENAHHNRDAWDYLLYLTRLRCKGRVRSSLGL